MNSFQCMAFCLFILVSEVNAQMSGAFKISKVAPDTFTEQVTFNADKTADVTYGWQIRSFTGSVTKWERATKEVRGTYYTQKIEDRIAEWQAATPANAERTKAIEKMIQFKNQGYDLYVRVNFKASDGSECLVPFVRKGNELVDFISGSIFKKSFWSF
jgi:hypothetical protein